MTTAVRNTRATQSKRGASTATRKKATVKRAVASSRFASKPSHGKEAVAHSIRTGFRQALTGQTLPVSQLWDGMEE